MTRKTIRPGRATTIYQLRGIWQISYFVHGLQRKESSHSGVFVNARDLLARRLKENGIPLPKTIAHLYPDGYMLPDGSLVPATHVAAPKLKGLMRRKGADGI